MTHENIQNCVTGFNGHLLEFYNSSNYYKDSVPRAIHEAKAFYTPFNNTHNSRSTLSNHLKLPYKKLNLTKMLIVTKYLHESKKYGRRACIIKLMIHKNIFRVALCHWLIRTSFFSLCFGTKRILCTYSVCWRHIMLSTKWKQNIDKLAAFKSTVLSKYWPNTIHLGLLWVKSTFINVWWTVVSGRSN